MSIQKVEIGKSSAATLSMIDQEIDKYFRMIVNSINESTKRYIEQSELEDMIMRYRAAISARNHFIAMIADDIGMRAEQIILVTDKYFFYEL